jgi:hypothetical protein
MMDWGTKKYCQRAPDREAVLHHSTAACALRATSWSCRPFVPEGTGPARHPHEEIRRIEGQALIDRQVVDPERLRPAVLGKGCHVRRIVEELRNRDLERAVARHEVEERLCRLLDRVVLGEGGLIGHPTPQAHGLTSGPPLFGLHSARPD